MSATWLRFNQYFCIHRKIFCNSIANTITPSNIDRLMRAVQTCRKLVRVQFVRRNAFKRRSRRGNVKQKRSRNARSLIALDSLLQNASVKHVTIPRAVTLTRLNSRMNRRKIKNKTAQVYDLQSSSNSALHTDQQEDNLMPANLSKQDKRSINQVPLFLVRKKIVRLIPSLWHVHLRTESLVEVRGTSIHRVRSATTYLR